MPLPPTVRESWHPSPGWVSVSTCRQCVARLNRGNQRWTRRPHSYMPQTPKAELLLHVGPKHRRNERGDGSPTGQTSSNRRTVTVSPTSIPSALRTSVFTGTTYRPSLGHGDGRPRERAHCEGGVPFGIMSSYDIDDHRAWIIIEIDARGQAVAQVLDNGIRAYRRLHGVEPGPRVDHTQQGTMWATVPNDWFGDTVQR